MGHLLPYRIGIHCAQALDDAELIEFHREVSRLARGAYGRTERYQQNYEMGMKLAQPRVVAPTVTASQWWQAQVEAFAKEYRELKAKRKDTAPRA